MLEMLKTSWMTRTMEERVERIELTVLPSVRLQKNKLIQKGRFESLKAIVYQLASRKARVDPWLKGAVVVQVKHVSLIF